jgi:hypothetical protein
MHVCTYEVALDLVLALTVFMCVPRRRVQSAWGHDVALSDHIIDVVEGKECVLIGTTFKEMSLRVCSMDCAYFESVRKFNIKH